MSKFTTEKKLPGHAAVTTERGDLSSGKNYHGNSDSISKQLSYETPNREVPTSAPPNSTDGPFAAAASPNTTDPISAAAAAAAPSNKWRRIPSRANHNYKHKSDDLVFLFNLFCAKAELRYNGKDSHFLGMEQAGLSIEYLKNRENFDDVMGDVIGHFTQLIAQHDFDQNKITIEHANELERQSQATISQQDREEYGCGYVKIVIGSVKWWRHWCNIVIDDASSNDSDKRDARKILEKIESWDENAIFSIIYNGETSYQTFKKRMSQKYPPVMHFHEDNIAFSDGSDGSGEEDVVKVHKIMIASTTPADTAQSRGLEGLLAGLMALSTSNTRGTPPIIGTKGEGMNSWNAAICGQTLHYSSDGKSIIAWFAVNHTRRNEALKQGSTPAVVQKWVEKRHEEICYYHSKEDDKSYIITIGDAMEYFGFVIGTWNYEQGIGIFDKTQLPYADKDYHFKNNTVTIRAGDRFHNWGQVSIALNREGRVRGSVEKILARLEEMKGDSACLGSDGKVIVDQKRESGKDNGLYKTLKRIRHKNAEEEDSVDQHRRSCLVEAGYEYLVNPVMYEQHTREHLMHNQEQVPNIAAIQDWNANIPGIIRYD
ncbi:hypothetical protein QTG54_006549 [Skeletonema marinoi]|uniref:Uncharacterized protein n=1 Tax=Skeletonema marinoi TaxID=267567 RepID=A0AAD8YB78_9STRA|nr:hypothetical protein QTG54_006549 [Skeletonema marinoi]